jgi:hypothetical protein
MGIAEQLDRSSILVGYLGAAVVIVAYFLTQKGWLRSDGWRFPAINLLGSALIMVSLVYHLNPPSVIIEIFWAVISVYGICKSLRTTRKARRVERFVGERNGN